MDCLSDTTCLTSLLDALNQFASNVDYLGYVLFGDSWSPIGPQIEVRADAFARLLDAVLLTEPSNCTQYASLVTANA